MCICLIRQQCYPIDSYCPYCNLSQPALLCIHEYVSDTSGTYCRICGYRIIDLLDASDPIIGTTKGK